MSGGRVEFDPPSMRRGASDALRVSRAVGHSAGRLSGLPIPEGTPPEIAGQLRSASAALDRSARSLASQASFLRVRARLALLADSPLSFLIDLLAPPLLSPFAPPRPSRVTPAKKKHNPWGPDFLWGAGKTVVDFGHGFGARAVSTAKDLGELGLIGTTIPGLPGYAPSYSDKDPREKMRNDYLKGLAWGAKHPKEFAKAVGRSTIAADEHSKHGHAYGAGANVLDAVTLLFGVGEISAAGKGARAGTTMAKVGGAEQRAAVAARTAQHHVDVAKTVKVSPRTGETPAQTLRREKLRDLAIANEKRHQASAQKIADDRRAELNAARDQARKAAEDLRKAMHPDGKQMTEKVGSSAAQTLAKEPLYHSDEERTAKPR